jgi:hypothetical protein
MKKIKLDIALDLNEPLADIGFLSYNRIYDISDTPERILHEPFDVYITDKQDRLCGYTRSKLNIYCGCVPRNMLPLEDSW